jgi:hypothetical protein
MTRHRHASGICPVYVYGLHVDYRPQWTPLSGEVNLAWASRRRSFVGQPTCRSGMPEHITRWRKQLCLGIVVCMYKIIGLRLMGRKLRVRSEYERD